jgi:hypothetical protein
MILGLNLFINLAMKPVRQGLNALFIGVTYLRHLKLKLLTHVLQLDLMIVLYLFDMSLVFVLGLIHLFKYLTSLNSCFLFHNLYPSLALFDSSPYLFLVFVNHGLKCGLHLLVRPAPDLLCLFLFPLLPSNLLLRRPYLPLLLSLNLVLPCHLPSNSLLYTFSFPK